LHRARQRRHDLGGHLGKRRGTRERQQPGGDEEARAARHAGTILTAHFLKSVCFEMGSVASRVTLLMSLLASNHGTKTTPRGIRLRPRVSTRTRSSPRRETTLTSAPWLMPRRRASSAFMKQTAPGNAL